MSRPSWMTEKVIRMAVRRYGLSAPEALKLLTHPQKEALLDRFNTWRDANGLPAENSPLSQGYLRTLLKSSGRLSARHPEDYDETWGEETER